MLRKREKRKLLICVAAFLLVFAGVIFLISYAMQDNDERLLKDKCFVYKVNQQLLYNENTQDLLIMLFLIDSKDLFGKTETENPEAYMVDTNEVKYPVTYEIVELQKEELYSVYRVSIRVQKESLKSSKTEFCEWTFGKQKFDIGSIVIQEGESRDGWCNEIEEVVGLFQNNPEKMLVTFTNHLDESVEVVNVSFDLPELEIDMDAIEIMNGVIPAGGTRNVQINIHGLEGRKNGVMITPVYTMKKGEETQQYCSGGIFQYLTAVSREDILEYLKENNYVR